MRYFAYKCTRWRSVRDCSQTERDDDRCSWNCTRRRFLQLDETAIGAVPRNNRTISFQIISAKCKCSVKCDANRVIASLFVLAGAPNVAKTARGNAIVGVPIDPFTWGPSEWPTKTWFWPHQAELSGCSSGERRISVRTTSRGTQGTNWVTAD